MITYTDIHAKIGAAVSANGSELAEGIDLDAITREIIATYGLIDIDAKDAAGEPVIGSPTCRSCAATATTYTSSALRLS